MTFVTDLGLYCMPFGLKNVRATYQRLINKMFQVQFDQNLEVCVDDMLIKSLEASSHLKDLDETFATLCHYNLKLNLAKCAFGISSSKFLSFLVTHRGIEANLDKIQALLEMSRLEKVS